ncbi:hypothetical protein LIA77_02222 [Sarocladium implicatum]|nr:hypothetical protein LIA77_02222 [Sarocladium implicatum]
MGITLREATLADADAICDVNFSAFSEDAVNVQTLPLESGTGPAFWKQGLVKVLESPDYHVLVITDSDTDQVIAFANWKRPGAPITEPPPASAWPQDGDPELAVRFFGTFSRVHKEIMGDKKHWYLELLATRRDAGGRGAARALLSWGLERAERDGVPVFLEATEEAEKIYSGKFGFKVLRREKVDVKTKVIDLPFMLWEPEGGRDPWICV